LPIAREAISKRRCPTDHASDDADCDNGRLGFRAVIHENRTEVSVLGSLTKRSRDPQSRGVSRQTAK
jgi:hypothetical protein